MSIEAVGAVLRARVPVTPTAKLILIGLADHAHPDGRNSYPSVPRLAEYAQIGQRAVQRTLRELEAAGLIVVQTRGGGRRATTYQLNLTLLAVLQSRDDADDTGGPQTTPGVAPRPPEPSLEPSTTPPYGGNKSSDGRETATSKARRHDPMWDALDALYGPPTELGRTLRGKVKRALTEAGATPEQIHEVVAAARESSEQWVRSLVVTETALAKHWPTLIRQVEEPGRRIRELVEEARRS